MTDTITLEIEGRDVEIDRAFLSLSEAEQQATVEEIAGSFEPKQGFMQNLNTGIAESAGGLVDLLNPFDKPEGAALLGMDFSTGSAVDGLKGGMNAIGVETTDAPPDGLLNSFGRGTGNAAGVMIPAGATANVMRGAGGLLGSVADDAAIAMNSKRGVIAELLAGGGSQTAGDAARDAGAGPTGVMAAQIAGGGLVGALPAAASVTPTMIGARKLSGAVKNAMLPYTNSGAREVAKRRFQELAGGEERAKELAQRIPADGGEIGLTPAQQTADPNMLAIEQQAARTNPALRERLTARAEASRGTAEGTLGEMGGDAAQTQAFFQERRKQAREAITSIMDRAKAADIASRPRVARTEAENSRIVAQQIELAQGEALMQEKALWDAVPRGAQVGTAQSMQAAQRIIANTPSPSQKHIPAEVRQFLGGDGFGEFETVANMHALYSELRRVAREAMARPVPNKRQASMANEVADSILDDLGANGAGTEIGQAIDTARAFSAEMHATFDQGAVGDILKRSVSGGGKLDDDLTLKSAMGTGGTSAAVGQRDIMRAAPTDATEGGIQDYLAGRFENAAFPEGEFKPAAASTYMRTNAPALEANPYLRQSLENSMEKAQVAQRTAQRGEAAISASGKPSKSPRAAFEQAPSSTAAATVFKAQRPARAAAELKRTARKDKTGAALSGLKGSFLDHVMTQSGMNGEKFFKFMQTPENRSAFKAVFEPTEVRRIDTIAAELRKLDRSQKAAPDIGELSNSSPNRIIEIVARVVAANQGARAGQGGASIQTANMASARVKKMLGNLQNDKAEQLMIDAVEDPLLLRALLMDPRAIAKNKTVRSRLAPYFSGTAASFAGEGQ